MCSEGIYDRYVNFYTDFAFKKLFGTEINKDLLISFLNALLQGREEIKNISYLNAEHLGTQEYDRRAVFDVYCTNERGEYFLVEMQKGEQQFFKDRSIYYSSFAMREQAPRGNWDYGLKAIYTIGILNFCFSTSTPSYYHEVKLMETDTKEVFYDKLEDGIRTGNFVRQVALCHPQFGFLDGASARLAGKSFPASVRCGRDSQVRPEGTL